MLYALNQVTSPEKVQLLDLEDYKNPYEVIKNQKRYDESVRSWLEFSINSISKDKRSRKTVNLNSYFSKFRETWETVMKELNIEFDVYGFTDEMKVKAFIKRTTQNRKILIKGNLQEDNIIIVVSDTGKGLDEEYRNNPSVIFNAFESSRCNKNGEKIGTGLGLYITKATVNEYKNSSIQILPQVEGFGIKITFKNLI